MLAFEIARLTEISCVSGFQALRDAETFTRPQTAVMHTSVR